MGYSCEILSFAAVLVLTVFLWDPAANTLKMPQPSETGEAVRALFVFSPTLVA